MYQFLFSMIQILAPKFVQHREFVSYGNPFLFLKLRIDETQAPHATVPFFIEQQEEFRH